MHRKRNQQYCDAEREQLYGDDRPCILADQFLVARSIEDVLQQRQSQDELAALFKSDPKMECLARLAMTDGIRGRKHFAAALNISEPEVTNLKKRMQRIYVSHLKQAMLKEEHHV